MLMTAMLILAGVASGSVPMREGLYTGRTDAVFQYDDGTANWITWGGLARGVWFHVDDFEPGATGFLVDTLEFWFYHHSSYPWDVASFYAELWQGGPGGPETILFQESVTAANGMVLVPVVPPIDPGGDFWVICNTMMSGGGWPAPLGDGTPQPEYSHSFFSDDGLVWEPWQIQGEHANDYFIRAHGGPVLGLEPATWGSIKVLFEE